jgi:hypothetical protein
VTETVTKKGNLKRKRKMWTGRYRPAGSGETGKNGAIPDPRFDALAGTHVEGSLGSTNLGRETASTSPL